LKSIKEAAKLKALEEANDAMAERERKVEAKTKVLKR
jgi:hypothetical protein